MTKIKGGRCHHENIMTRVVALTGTPGTGKSSVAMLMEGAGWQILELTDLARRSDAVVGRDEERQTDEVDLEILSAAVAKEKEGVPPERDLLLVSHMAHLMPCDLVAVLRTSPRVLRERLEARRWPGSKVQENVEAEAVGVVLVEAMELEPPVPVLELDTSFEPPEETMHRLVQALAGEEHELEAGHVDWSEEVMGWY